INFSGEIIADGCLHRFYIEGHRRGTLNGAYVLHTDGCPAGYIQDFTTGLSQTWRADGGSERLPLRVYEQIEAAKHERVKELAKNRNAAAERAIYLWRQSKPATSHPYLIRKGIQA